MRKRLQCTSYCMQASIANASSSWFPNYKTPPKPSQTVFRGASVATRLGELVTKLKLKNKQLQCNAKRDKSKCQTLAIDDMALGPGHVAWKFILACKAEQPSIAFNDEEIDCMALQIWDIEEARGRSQIHSD